MIIVRQLRHHKGIYCRTCGIAVGREAQNATLIAGWWGVISFFWNFVVIARNASRLRWQATLPPAPASPLQWTSEPSVWRRGGIKIAGLVAVLVVAGGGYLIYANNRQAALVDLQVGQCVSFSADETQIVGVVDCGSTHGGKVVALNADGTCPFKSETFGLTKDGVASSVITCIDTTQ